MSTYFPKEGDIVRKWFVVDATGLPLGRQIGNRALELSIPSLRQVLVCAVPHDRRGVGPAHRTGTATGDGGDIAFVELLGSEKLQEEKREKRATARAKRFEEVAQAAGVSTAWLYLPANRDIADQIKELREKESYPILKEFETWLLATAQTVLPKSPIGKAIHYTYGIYRKLIRYTLDGRYRIDNNLAENSVRDLALGRKNYLFCGNHESARRTAVIYSLMASCKVNDVNPQEWLTDVLNRIKTKRTKRWMNYCLIFGN